MADSNKTEQPTDKKLKDSREKGSVAHSQELSAALQILVFSAIFTWASANALKMITGSFRRSFSGFSEHTLNVLRVKQMLFSEGMTILGALMPFLAAITLASLAAGVLQSGFSFSPKALRFDLSRLNPMSNWSKIFSGRSWVELLKSFLKIGIVGYLVYGVFMSEQSKIMSLPALSLSSVLQYASHLFTSILGRLVMFFVAFAALDFAWQKFDFLQNLKMTKQEIKDEYRQSEGDTRSKSMIRSWHKRRINTRMISAIKEATFVTVNPTHFATALKYKRGMKAPLLLAKGLDELAFRIREEAKKYNIPVIESPKLTRDIYYNTRVGRYVPANLYKAIAKILAHIFRLERERARNAR